MTVARRTFLRSQSGVLPLAPLRPPDWLTRLWHKIEDRTRGTKTRVAGFFEGRYHPSMDPTVGDLLKGMS
jgi:hypothetical protein